LVDGIYRLLHTEFSEPVNIGNPVEITVLELAREILAMVPGSKSKIIYNPLPQDDPKRRKPDITRAQTLLGWNPTIDRAVPPLPLLLPSEDLPTLECVLQVEWLAPEFDCVLHLLI